MACDALQLGELQPEVCSDLAYHFVGS